MATTTTENKTTSSSSDEKSTSSRKPKSKYQHHSPARETIESLVVAFILAFLFRTFEAEAFVIPTGSMAETLNGRHKEVDCTQCGWHYHIGASQEVRGETGIINPGARLQSSVCPNCRFVNAVKDLPVFHGDRILVNKFPYEIGNPVRWDVIVFKNPEEPMRNFIKRLVGLPNEFLRIDGGDVYARKDEQAEWEILRKRDPDKQQTLGMIVYDNDHPETLLIQNDWPERWAAVLHDVENDSGDGLQADPNGWQADHEKRAFLTSAAQNSQDWKWLRYRHFIPDEDDWQAVIHDPILPFEDEPAAKLISDFCGYNETQTSPPFVNRVKTTGEYWVGDLTLDFEIDVQSVGTDAGLIVELTEGVRDYQCLVDLNSGKVTLRYFDQILDQQKELESAETSLRGEGVHRLSFANVDNRLDLWIDGKLIPFPNRGEYSAPATSIPTRRDLSPAGIAVRGADVAVAHLKILRDIYYRAEQSMRNQLERMARERNRGNDVDSSDRSSRADLLFALDEPERYAELYLKHEHAVEFPQLGPDEFFVLGDNSPASLDSRLWDNTHAVPRHDLLGKAFYVYWPHGVPFMNDGEGYPITYHQLLERDGDTDPYPKLRIPFYPNVKRMERIR